MLFWDDPQDDSITGYRILRQDKNNNPDGDFQTLVEDTGSADATYTDDTVEPDLVYVYRVLAISPGGVSEPSRDVRVSTAAPVAPPEPLRTLRTLRAHAATTLVENLAQETHGDVVPTKLSVGQNVRAQAFTTGSNPAGYNVSGVKLYIIQVPEAPADVSVELWSATGGATPRPQARIATLTHSTRRFATGVNTFNAPADTRLADGTTYFLFASYVGPRASDLEDLGLVVTVSTSVDDGSAAGWSVGGRFHRTHTPQGAWVHGDAAKAAPIQFGILGRFAFATQDVSELSGQDLPATTSTTGRILVNGTATGNIDRDDDIDWFATLLYAGHRYQIDVEGADTNQGTLADPSLSGLQGYSSDAPDDLVVVPNTGDSDSGEGNNARKKFTLPAGFETGTYYIAVGSSNNATGTYRLRLRDVLELNGDKLISAQLEPGDTVSGTFDQHQWYYFALDGLKPGRYTVSFSKGAIETMYSGPLTRSGGGVVHLTTDQPRRATHTFDVRPGTTQIRYLWLVVREDAGDYTATLEETMPDLVVGGRPLAGETPALGGSDSLAPFGGYMMQVPVELEAGRRYLVEIKGAATGDGTLSRPMLGDIRAPDGSYVGGYNNLFVLGDCSICNVRYVFTADQDGVYFLKVGGRLLALSRISDAGVTIIFNRYVAGTFKVAIRRD